MPATEERDRARTKSGGHLRLPCQTWSPRSRWKSWQGAPVPTRPFELVGYRRGLKRAIAPFDKQNPVRSVRADLQAQLDQVIVEQTTASGSPVRDHDLVDQLKTMPDSELKDTQRGVETGLALMRPQSRMHAPVSDYPAAVDAELARRIGQQI